jgi:hypothetical protein
MVPGEDLVAALGGPDGQREARREAILHGGGDAVDHVLANDQPRVVGVRLEPDERDQGGRGVSVVTPPGC